MANKYSDLIDKGAVDEAPSISSGANKYAEILDSESDQLQQSAFAASKTDPDKRAESIKLGKKLALPTDVVERNIEKVKSDSALIDFKPNKILKNTPGLGRWLQNPDNATVGKDDLPNLEATEKVVQDHSLTRTLHDSLAVGFAKMNATAARIPALLYDTFALPQNLLMKAIGSPERQVQSPDWLMNNPVANYYDKAAGYAHQIPELNESVIETIGKGDYAHAGKLLAAQFAANAPNQAAIIAGITAGYGAATLVGAGAMTAADANKDAATLGVDPAIGVSGALAKGAIEGGFESLGTYGILKHWEGAIVKSYGKETAKQVMTDFVKTISYSMAGEGNEEFATSIAQDMIDYLTGVNPKALDGILTRAADAGVIGAASGGLMTGPTAIGAGSYRAMQVRQANIDKDFYLSLGDTSEASKVRERLPEAQKELVKEITKNGPVETIYVPVSAMTAYFQKKNEPPSKVAADLGITKQFDEAVETGGDVAIPTDVWVEKIVGTEHYKALANDVKFNSGSLTVNEAKEAEKEMAAAEKEAQTSVDDTEKKYAASAKEVRTRVTEQLVATGMPQRDASAQAALYESAFKSLGTRSGTDPLELFNKYGLTINGRAQDGTVLNQGKVYTFDDVGKSVKKTGNDWEYGSSFQKFSKDDTFTLQEISLDKLDRRGEKPSAELTLESKDDESWAKIYAQKFTSETAEPIVVQIKDDGSYHIVDGRHRSRAAFLRGEKTIKAFVPTGKQSTLFQPVARQNELGFYSKLEQVIAQKMSATQPVDSLRAMLRDIKPEEMKWSGLDDFLKGKEKVSKAEVQDFLRANQLEVKEVTLGGATSEEVSGEYYINDNSKPDDPSFSVVDWAGNEMETFGSEDDAQEWIDSRAEAERATKFSEYTLPGGENYREVLLTMPAKEGDLVSDISIEQNTDGEWDVKNEAGRVIYTGTERTDAVAYKNELQREREVSGKNQFKSSHFDEKNILAHVRLNDRTDADGKNVLFVEEIQSDWHQAGRKKGYKGEVQVDPELKALADEYDKVWDERREAISQLRSGEITSDERGTLSLKDFKKGETRDVAISGPRTVYRIEEIGETGDNLEVWYEPELKNAKYSIYYNGSLTEKFKNKEQINEHLSRMGVLFDRLRAIKEKRNELAAKYNEIAAKEKVDLKIGDFTREAGGQYNAVPDAPFKKTWHEFALKRVIRMAAEGGYERVAWTTGEQQAERYDLSKSISEVHYSGSNLKAYDLNGNEVISRTGIAESELDDYIGKEAAQKLLEQPMKGTLRSLTGQQLKVGGEGMKGFYDNILVKSAEKLVKKFGGKVGETKLTTENDEGYFSDGFDTKMAAANHRARIRFGDVAGAEVNGKYDIIKSESTGLYHVSEVKTDSKIGSVHSIDITPELKTAAVNEGFSLFQENRGKISFGSDRKFNIELLKDANLSTFLHETGHFYLEILGDLAETDGANQQITEDFATLLNWFGVSSRAEIKVEHHEQFARGFEAYLMDGKAPSSKLRKVFAKFKVWLSSIYKSIQGLDVQLTAEVRSVMNRIVAADDEIKQTQAELNHAPLFADPQAAGMSESQSANYIEAREEARLFAEEKVTNQLMETVRRERTREYKERRNQVKSDVTAQVDQMNVVKAQAILQRGKMPDGSPLPDGTPQLKLDRQSLVDQYGAEFVKNLPKPYIYSREGGVHPDAAASILQFESGDALIQALMNTPPRSELIEQMVDQRMDQIYPDMLTDGSLPKAAIDAVINERMAYVNRLELEWLQSYEPGVAKNLTRKIGQRKLPSSQQLKDQARQMIGDRAVGDIKPYLYLRAHVKYHNEALKLFTRGDIDAAFDAKKKSVINEALYNQALLANEDIKKSVKFFKRLSQKDEDVSKSRDVDLVNAARAVLSKFGLDRMDKSADEYLKKMAEYDPDRYENIKGIVDSVAVAAGHYKTVRYDDFVAMKDAVESLWSLAKSSKEIEIDGKRVDIDIAKEELITKTVETSSKQPRAQYNKTADKNDKFKVKLLAARASLTRIETWADVMDVKHGGPFRKYIWQPISDATLKYRENRLRILAKYEALIRGYEKNLSKEKIQAPNLNFVFQNKAELMMAVLHSGNNSNLHKLLVGRGWGAVNQDGSLNRVEWDRFIDKMQFDGVLTKADYDFAQNIWDLLDSLKPETQKAHKQMYGYYFNEVTADDVRTRFGDYRGGYVPAKVDTYANEDAAIRREREEIEKNNNSFSYPTTGRGFTKSRVESYTAPLSLDMNLLGSHIDGVLRFTYIEPRVKEVSRLVLDKQFRKALGEIDQTVAKDALIPWLQRAAQQQVVLPSNDGLGRALDGAASFLRSNVATQIMFGNITNTLQQTTGMVVAMSKVRPKNIRNALASYLSSPKKTSEAILEKSPWMKSNQDNSIYEISNSINEIILNPSTFEKFKTFSKKHTYFLQSHAQNMVNTVVWQGAYDQAVSDGMVEKEAVRFADSVVRTTQGTNRPEDISRFETGTKTELLFKQFVGYFNMLANLNAGELIKISRQVGLKKGAGRAFYVYMTALMLPAVLSEMIVMAMSGKGLDQDDDDEYLDDILKAFFGSQFKTIAATVPYGGQFATAAYNRAFTDSRADDRLSLSPALSVLEGAVGTPVEIYNAIADDANNQKQVVKDSLTLIGIMTGLPAGPLGKPTGYMMDVQSGKAEPSGPVDFTRGLMTGKAGQ